MIGVIVDSREHLVVQEFFELFKTPWEFYHADSEYDVLIIASSSVVRAAPARLVIQYASVKTMEDGEGDAEEQVAHRTLSYKEWRVPLYGASTTFQGSSTAFLLESNTARPTGYKTTILGRPYVRIGYDLFQEIRALLTHGQPIDHASIPTVELHIALLRDLIVESGVLLVEIPPVPAGHAYIASLTHDVDHPGIRFHKWDHTTWGFLYRAIVGTLVDLVKGRVPLRHLFTNWVAAAKLPLVYLGLAKDSWSEFDRYCDMEKGLGSTYFVLPFKGEPGLTVSGKAPGTRASGYGVENIEGTLRKISSSGQEIGLHGIDAWLDAEKGLEEKAKISKVTGEDTLGVRMHWLYYNDNSPSILELVGFEYDSTVGYNQTVGYRSGTTQVYKPLQVQRLLELPLHVMDTALFYPRYLNYTKSEAMKRVVEMVDVACQFGGVMTINWHDRSIAPERLWGECYRDVLVALQQTGAWRTSAGHTVSWFQNRRAVTFKRSEHGIEILQAKRDGTSCQNLPGLKAYIHNSAEPCGHVTADHMEIPIQCDEKVVISTTGVLQQDNSFRIHSGKQFI